MCLFTFFYEAVTNKNDVLVTEKLKLLNVLMGCLKLLTTQGIIGLLIPLFSQIKMIFFYSKTFYLLNFWIFWLHGKI